ARISAMWSAVSPYSSANSEIARFSAGNHRGDLGAKDIVEMQDRPDFHRNWMLAAVEAHQLETHCAIALTDLVLDHVAFETVEQIAELAGVFDLKLERGRRCHQAA